mmetsp:Transcript_10049/g.40585  ORF Transcript_10049/g.40585 Transcript_10049/m.40585 type:complete len:500 (+) Transcript_10049:1467-2966(+)
MMRMQWFIAKKCFAQSSSRLGRWRYYVLNTGRVTFSPPSTHTHSFVGFRQTLDTLGNHPVVDGLVPVDVVVGRGHGIFQAGGAVEQQHAVRLLDLSVRESLLERGVGRGALGAQQESLLLGKLRLSLVDGVVGDRDGPPAGLAHRAEDEEIADGGGHADTHRAAGEGVVDARGEFLAGVVGVDHRGAPGGLDGDHLGQLGIGLDQAELLELAERLPHADEPGSAAGGVHDDVGEVVPAKLLHELEAHGLLTLDPVRFLEGGGVEPVHLLFAAADDLAAVVDVAVDAPDVGALERHLANVGVRGILGGEDVRLDAAAGAVRGHGRSGVAVRGHGHAGHAELLRHGDGHDEAAGLEGAGGQATLILDEERAALLEANLGGELGGVDDGGHPLAEGDAVLRLAHGEHLSPLPQSGRAGSEDLAGQLALERLEVVADEEGLAGVGEAVELVGFVLLAGEGAFEMGDECPGDLIVLGDALERPVLREFSSGLDRRGIGDDGPGH